MNMPGVLAIGLAVIISSGCAARFSQDAADASATPNRTANLNLGVSAEAIRAEHGQPLYKRGRIDSDGSRLEDWFYLDAILSFKDDNLDAFRPR
ncbi:MAG: hypothetical protein EA420_18600 [Candidatus Competibacteraceae bacterium]|nr:MAG: hypothetical protein EA420_18600 [Candidatus Competibacteraceae bacterium]